MSRRGKSDTFRGVRICFLALSAPYRPWKDLENLCLRSTWMNTDFLKNNPFFFYEGLPVSRFGQARNSLLSRRLGKFLWRNNLRSALDLDVHFVSKDQIIVNVPDRWDTMILKFLSSINLLVETLEFDYLVKVNSTTFVNYQNLENWLKHNHPIQYGGVFSKYHFASGWATVISRETIFRLLDAVRNQRFSLRHNVSLYEDEHLGFLMRELGVQSRPIPFSDLSGKTEEFLPKELPEKVFVRIKNTRGSRVWDADYFHQVHKFASGALS